MLGYGGCELLQKVYLCSNTNNAPKIKDMKSTVVNCFKKCIFAVTQTTKLKLSLDPSML